MRPVNQSVQGLNFMESIGLLAGIVIAATIHALFPKFTVDDAYILFRYATNLVENGELNWNVGQDPVEGYTGVAMVTLLSLLYKAGISPLIASKLIGIGAFFFTGLVLYRFARTLGISSVVRTVAVLFYLCTPVLYTNAVSGLETTLFTAAVITSIYLLYLSIVSAEHAGRMQTLLVLSLLLTSLARPEGVALAAFSLLALLFITMRHDHDHWTGTTARIFFLYVLPGAVYFTWRWSYYGQFLPNTFYAKSSEFNIHSFWAFESFLLFIFAIPGIIAAIALAVDTDLAVAKLREKQVQVRRALATTAMVSAGFLVVLSLLYLRSRLVMNFSFRFFVPFIPVLILGFAFFIDLGMTVTKDTSRENPVRSRFVILMISIALLIQAFSYAMRFPDEFHYARTYGQMLRDEHVAVGKWLREHIPSTEWLVVVGDAGANPYYSQLRTVDFGALNDEILRTLSDAERVDYFYSFNPGAVTFSSYKPDKISGNQKAIQIAADPRFSRYRLVKKYGSDARNFYQFLYLRDDLVTP